MDDVKALRAHLGRLAHHTAEQFTDLRLAQLGDLHRALRAALAEVEEALGPKIAAGAEDGHTYVELAHLSGYRSVTTIVRIMRDMGASPGRGHNHPATRVSA